MSWTCPSCRTVNATEAPRCTVCGGAADAPRTAGSGAPTVPVVTRVPAAAPIAAAAGSQGGPPPAAAVAEPTRWSRGPFAALVVVVVALVVGLAVVLLGADAPADPAAVDAGGGGGASDTALPTSDPDSGDRPTPTEQAIVDPSVSPTVAPGTATTVPAPTPASRVSVVPDDRWITVLHSRAKSEQGVDQVLAEATRLAASHGDDRVRVVDSDATPHMRSGYWVIVLVDFDSRAEALSWCDDYGLAVGDCYPRQTRTGER